MLARGEHCFVILNAYPYANGHLMVAPYAHTAAIEELPEAASAELMQLVRRSIGALREAYGPEGFNVGANLGTVAGAGVADHVHVHVVPRWEGDTNFMTALADTRVLPESLEDTQRNLKEAFARL